MAINETFFLQSELRIIELNAGTKYLFWVYLHSEFCKQYNGNISFLTCNQTILVLYNIT